jgi:hypothetical protein
MTQIQECQQNGVFAFINRRLEALKRDRPVVLRLKSLLNREPNLACPARTPFLCEAIEGHPNRFGVAADRSGLRTFRARRFQALEHNLAKGALWGGSASHPFIERG